MPVPAFGFSAGDIVSAIGLVRKIGKALKRTGGASTEYQHAIIDLKSLENVLRHLESLELNQENEKHINAIRGMALACQLPLRDFWTKLEKYEASLGPFSSPQWFRGLPQKSKWAITFAEEVEKMRAMVAAKTVSISLLLAMDLSYGFTSSKEQDHTLTRKDSKSLSDMKANLGKRQEKEYSELLSKAAEHRSTLGSVERRIINIEDGIQQAAQTSDKKFEALSSDVQETKATIMSLRGVGQQIMSFVSAFPLEMRDLLQKILQSNWQIYNVLLSIQQSPKPSPTQSLDSNIQFEDAMGELIPLPYVYFRHWETFEGFLRSHFKGTIGEVKVVEGQYNILKVDKGGAMVKKDHWTRSIDQGARISMSMIMSRLRRARGQCPRPSCTGSRFVQHHVRINLLTCELCNLKFYAEAGELEDTFGHVTVQDQEEQVAQKQVEEDLRIYGTRHVPSDAVDLDEEEKLSKLPAKRSALEFEAGVDRPAKARKKSESRTYNYENITAMDWNAGESPMMAWVNQSAVPAAIPLGVSSTDPPVSKDEELLQQERKEIEIFKNVHVSDALAPANNAKFAANLECGSDLDFGVQIYHRNIVDRYPLLPPYLARRLAIANHSRAERLQQSRLRNGPRGDIVAKAIDKPQVQSGSNSLNVKNVANGAPSIPLAMPEEKAATNSHRKERLTDKERRLVCEYHEKFPGLKQTELGAIFGIERATVSKILRSKHKYLGQDLGREPPHDDKSQSKISKPLERLDESVPWSSWSEITAAGSYAMEHLGSPASSNKPMTIDFSRMSIPDIDPFTSDVLQDELYNPDFQLAQASQSFTPQDRFISPVSPFLSPPSFVERDAIQAYPDSYGFSSCYYEDRRLTPTNDHGWGSYTAPSPPYWGEASSPKPEQDFWTERRQSHRPSSVQSYGSSRNSSLHGSPALDPSYQSPVFSTEDPRHGSIEAGNSPRGLFPAPIDWTTTQARDQVSKIFSFDCEICGEVVKASRRLNWQNHVMNDLRPYVCTVEDCNRPDETYSTVRDYLRHEITFHEMPHTVAPIDGFAKSAGKSITCLFCGQQTTEGRGQHSRERHVGQHMEEIAFTVVPKAYEDWEFYSEASSGKQSDKRTDANASGKPKDLSLMQVALPTIPGKPRFCMRGSCNGVELPSTAFLLRHEREVHAMHREKPFSCYFQECDRAQPGQGFPRRWNLCDHMKRVHNYTMTEYSPPRNDSPSSRTPPDSHVHRCDKTNPSTGKPCNMVFTRAYDLTRHEDIIHSSRKRKVRCQICTEDKSFSRNDALTRHMRVVHPDVEFPGKKQRGVSPISRKAAELGDGVLLGFMNGGR